MARAARPSAAREIRRGAVWWVDLDPARGTEIRKTRPAVILSADAINRARGSVVIVPLSTGPSPNPPITVAIPSAGPTTVAVCDQVRAVDKTRLLRADGILSAHDLAVLENAVRSVLLL